MRSQAHRSYRSRRVQSAAHRTAWETAARTAAPRSTSPQTAPRAALEIAARTATAPRTAHRTAQRIAARTAPRTATPRTAPRAVMTSHRVAYWAMREAAARAVTPRSTTPRSVSQRRAATPAAEPGRIWALRVTEKARGRAGVQVVVPRTETLAPNRDRDALEDTSATRCETCERHHETDGKRTGGGCPRASPQTTDHHPCHREEKEADPPPEGAPRSQRPTERATQVPVKGQESPTPRGTPNPTVTPSGQPKQDR